MVSGRSSRSRWERRAASTRRWPWATPRSAPARTRTSRCHGRRAGQGRAGDRLQRAGQGGRQPEALRRLRPAGGRARLQHDRHDRHPQGRVGLRRFRRGGLGRRCRDARVPAGEPRLRRLRARLRGGRAGRGSQGAERRAGLRDDQHADPRRRRPAAGRAPDLDAAAQRRRAAHPAGEVPRRAVRAPIRRRFQGGVGADDSTTQRPAALLAQGSTRPSLQPTPQTRPRSRSASRAR